MRQRISCLVLILVLTIPAAGLAKGAELDPNGLSDDVVVETYSGETSGRSLFHLFVVWLQAQLRLA